MTTSTGAVKALARFALHRLGMIHAVSWSHRQSFQILTYHRFTDVKTVDPVQVLTRHCGYIRKHFRPVSLSQVEHALHQGAPLPSQALVSPKSPAVAMLPIVSGAAPLLLKVTGCEVLVVPTV